MKMLLVALALCLTFTAHAQGTWPRNAKTGKVEFTGTLPWPATVKTEAQRRALVRRWYLAKLTDSTPEEVAADVQTTVSLSLLTYDELPIMSAIEQGMPNTGFRLLYQVKLMPTKTGLSYTIADFTFARRSDDDSTPLEPHLAAPAESEKAALAELRKRLVAATKSLQ